VLEGFSSWRAEPEGGTHFHGNGESPRFGCQRTTAVVLLPPFPIKCPDQKHRDADNARRDANSAPLRHGSSNRAGVTVADRY